MQLILKKQYEQLLKNGCDRSGDYVPVVKLFTPDAGCTWLLTDIDPDDQDIAFGLCDLGQGFPELGAVYLPDIRNLRGALGLPVERDICFVGKFPISVYAEAARQKRGITLNEQALLQAQAALESRERGDHA